MQLRLVFVLLLAVCSTTVAAEKEKGKKKQTPQEALAAILKERRDGRRAFSAAYSRAKTAKEKNKVVRDLYPRPGKYAPRFMELAKANPKDPIALKCLTEVISAVRQGKMFKEAMAILTKEHAGSKSAGNVCMRLVYSSSAETEKFLRLVLDKNKHRDAAGKACFTLGRYRKRIAATARALKANPARATAYRGFYGAEFFKQLTEMKPEDIDKECENLFVRVTKEFADIRSYGRTLGQMAGQELFEIRNLAIGKVAPDIKGEDIDGVTFKLSDYRGKVVVIDFWGDW